MDLGCSPPGEPHQAGAFGSAASSPRATWAPKSVTSAPSGSGAS
jgi:hypothetical protein